MSANVVFLIVMISLINFPNPGESCKGCVALDEHNFKKIISRFNWVLVKFDVGYPYGPKHDVYTKLAEEISDLDDFLMAEVGIKDYGDRENEQLSMSYGITKDDLPAVRLFVAGNKQSPVKFSGKDDSEWSVDNLRNLIRDNTDLYLGLPGCVEEFDKLAMKFVNSGNKQELLEKAEQIDVNNESAPVYVKYMRKIIENGGGDFVRAETARIHKLIQGKISEKKAIELKNRLNILRSFSINKDEL